MSSVSVDEMRRFIARVYGGNWKERVEDMPDNQVMAIYFSFQEQGNTEPKPRRRNEKPRKNRDRGNRKRYDPYERFTDESDADYYDRINGEL